MEQIPLCICGALHSFLCSIIKNDQLYLLPAFDLLTNSRFCEESSDICIDFSVYFGEESYLFVAVYHPPF